jgi:hypothetical protein
MAIWRRYKCWIIKATRGQAYASIRAPTPTPTRTSTHLHTHTHKYVRLTAFTRPKWLQEGASMVSYTYVASLFLWSLFLSSPLTFPQFLVFHTTATHDLQSKLGATLDQRLH